MTMSEFNIRFFAYNRLEKKEYQKIFEINRIVIGAGGMIDNKIKKDLFNSTKQICLGNTIKSAPKKHIDMFRQKLKEYQNRK